MVAVRSANDLAREHEHDSVRKPVRPRRLVDRRLSRYQLGPHLPSSVPSVHLMKRFLLVSLTLAASLGAQIANAKSMFTPGVGPSPVDIKTEIVSMSGTGCPQGGAVATMSPDGSSVSILFDKMSTELPASPQVHEQKMCMIRLGFRFPGKYRVAVVGSDARGFVSVPAGGQSTIAIQHYSIFHDGSENS